METQSIYSSFEEAQLLHNNLLAILIDPDKFDLDNVSEFLNQMPSETTHIFVGGSTVAEGQTKKVIRAIKIYSKHPVIIFPGDYSQITNEADALLFLSLLSGRNPEYLIEQQIKSVEMLKGTQMEVIPTAYILIDGGHESAVEKVTQTTPISQNDVDKIVKTAMAGQLLGAKLVYLEAGSGAIYPVGEQIISEVKKEISIPLIVGGGIRSEQQLAAAYEAGANMVVMGTAFEK
ncbi:MAG: geranylgeranylglyceryl/heptaprenylglyceryl phosphate synthase [Flavobacteriaceae bacterium]|nr:geranylgeranylglyceryl/heptaprenylglyceryl phosphate synthase [Flavobacteriaceae bacterium]